MLLQKVANAENHTCTVGVANSEWRPPLKEGQWALLARSQMMFAYILIDGRQVKVLLSLFSKHTHNQGR